MEQALFINGAYENVLDEIMKSQEKNAGMVFYLQPYSTSKIKQLSQYNPSVQSPLTLYLSITNQLNQICYVATIMRWENKQELTVNRLKGLNEHISKFQPGEEKIYLDVKGKNCINLISIINLKKLTNHLSVTNLLKVNDGKPLKPRTRSGGWSYVYSIPLL